MRVRNVGGAAPFRFEIFGRCPVNIKKIHGELFALLFEISFLVLKVPKREIFDGVFLHKSSLTRPKNRDLEQFPFFSKIRQDIRIFCSYAHAQHAHIVTTRMLSISIVLLHVCSAYAYCYYAYAQ